MCFSSSLCVQLGEKGRKDKKILSQNFPRVTSDDFDHLFYVDHSLVDMCSIVLSNQDFWVLCALSLNEDSRHNNCLCSAPPRSHLSRVTSFAFLRSDESLLKLLSPLISRCFLAIFFLLLPLRCRPAFSSYVRAQLYRIHVWPGESERERKISCFKATRLSDWSLSKERARSPLDLFSQNMLQRSGD